MRRKRIEGGEESPVGSDCVGKCGFAIKRARKEEGTRVALRGKRDVNQRHQERRVRQQSQGSGDGNGAVKGEGSKQFFP